MLSRRSLFGLVLVPVVPAQAAAITVTAFGSWRREVSALGISADYDTLSSCFNSGMTPGDWRLWPAPSAAELVITD